MGELGDFESRTKNEITGGSTWVANERGCPEPGEVRNCGEGLSLTCVVAASENQ